MNILVVGDWHSDLHEEGVFQAFAKIGHEPFRFSWHQYFRPTGLGRVFSALFKAQNKYILGPTVVRLNEELTAFALKIKPDAIFIYRGTHIYSRTIKRIKKGLNGVVVVGYNNDDPFSSAYPFWKWRHFQRCIPDYDLVLAYRHHNIDEYLAAGARRVELLRSWFIPERNFPVRLTGDEEERYASDVVFVGHYEDDGRLELLEAIAAGGWRLRVFGPGWDPAIRRSHVLAKQAPVRVVWGGDYNRALCGAKIALCFFSRLNRDTYTRRCFEIPASGTLLMSEYTNDMASLFKSEEEAVFFEGKDELCRKLDELLRDDVTRNRIASAGTARVWGDGHDIVSRMRLVLGWIEEIKGNKIVAGAIELSGLIQMADTGNEGND